MTSGPVQTFQLWAGVGVEDITFAYPPDAPPSVPIPGLPVTVGVENPTGTQGESLRGPLTDQRLVTRPAGVGGTMSIVSDFARVGRGAVTVDATATMRGEPWRWSKRAVVAPAA